MTVGAFCLCFKLNMFKCFFCSMFLFVAKDFFFGGFSLGGLGWLRQNGLFSKLVSRKNVFKHV